MSEDEKLQRYAELREKWERDELSARHYYKETGYNEGKAEIAKKMKDENINIDMIIKITGLSKEEIEKL